MRAERAGGAWEEWEQEEPQWGAAKPSTAPGGRTVPHQQQQHQLQQPVPAPAAYGGPKPYQHGPPVPAAAQGPPPAQPYPPAPRQTPAQASGGAWAPPSAVAAHPYAPQQRPPAPAQYGAAPAQYGYAPVRQPPAHHPQPSPQLPPPQPHAPQLPTQPPPQHLPPARPGPTIFVPRAPEAPRPGEVSVPLPPGQPAALELQGPTQGTMGQMQPLLGTSAEGVAGSRSVWGGFTSGLGSQLGGGGVLGNGAGLALASAGMAALGGGGGGVEDLAKNAAMAYVGKAEGHLNAYTGSTLATLRYYFAVNQAYVLGKLKIVCFPFKHREWERRTGEDGQPLPPKADLNAPDLYLPLMAYVTYILAYGFALGTEGRFTSPDVLGLAGSSGMAIVLLETAMTKLGFYLHGVAVPLLDVVALCGYKFLGAVATLAAAQAGGANARWAATLLCSLCIGTFVVKTLRSCARPEGFTPGFLTQGVGSPGKRAKKETYLLWAAGGMQVLWLWYLCRM